MEERRIVTVLFADIVGSTALASDVDAEDWAELIRAVFPLMIDPIERHGGTVARLMGDGLLAFFGAPIAREDDPHRAILAALDIQHGIAAERDRFRTDYGFAIDVRVGINTGLVVTGEFGSHAASEYTALGDTVNVAARMEQTAEPGTIQVTAETYRLVLPHFEFQPLGLVAVKGKADGVDGYRVLGRAATPGRQRGLQDFAVPLVGRERELDLLRYRLRELDTGRGGVVAILGEAGLGKSRLLDELRRSWLDSPDHESGSWLEDQLVSFEETTPYGLVHRRLARDLDITDGIPLTIIEEHLAESLSGADAMERARALQAAGHLFSSTSDNGTPVDGLGIDGAAEFRQELALLCERIWRARSREYRGCVYVIEDFHCVDASSGELLEQLIPRLADLPLLIILTLRPERGSLSWSIHEHLAAGLGIKYLSLALVPLAQRETDAFLDALLPGADIPASLRHMILERVGGNPLFAEELVRSLIEHGYFMPLTSPSGPHWSAAADLDLNTVEIPATVQALIQQRVDMLDEDTRHTLHLAAVIGRSFQYDQLLELIGDPATLDEHLAALQSAMLVRADTQAGDGSYAFHHALIWESIYRSMLRSTLQRLHLQVGEALERLYFGDREQHAGQLATHFAMARDARAVAYAETAGMHAQAMFAPQEAIEHFSRALRSLRDSGGSPSARILRQRGRALEILGNFNAARQDFDAALELARGSDDRREEWETLVDIGRSWEGVDYGQAGLWFERALELARRLDDPRALGESLNRVGTWYTNTERLDEANAALLEALAIFEELGDELGVAATADYLGVVADLSGDLAEMRARFEQAVPIFERRGELQALSSTLASMVALSGGFVFETVSSAPAVSHEQAEQWGLRAVLLAREMDWRAGESYAHMNLGGLYLMMARYDDALSRFTEAHDIASEIDHREWLTAALGGLGYLLQEILALERAVARMGQSLDLARESGSAHFVNFGIGAFADVLIENAALDRAAEVLATSAADLPIRTIGQRRVWVARANWLFVTGESEAALEILDELFDSAVHCTSQADIPFLAWRRGRVLAQLDPNDEALEALQAAKAGMARLGSFGRLWRIQLDLARLYRARGQESEALEAIDAAREIVAQLAPRIPADNDLRANFQRSAQAMIRAVASG